MKDVARLIPMSNYYLSFCQPFISHSVSGMSVVNRTKQKKPKLNGTTHSTIGFYTLVAKYVMIFSVVAVVLYDFNISMLKLETKIIQHFQFAKYFFSIFINKKKPAGNL